MRAPAILLVLVMVALAALPVAGAQTPSPATDTLIQMTLDELPPDGVVTLGMIRTTYDVGGSLRVATGSGPSVHVVETGAVSVSAEDDATPPLVVRAQGSSEPATPRGATAGSETTLAAGDGLVLPPGATVELRNAGDTPATVLDLLAAPDGAVEAETGVTRSVLVQREVTLPEPPLVATLVQTSLAPGDQLALPPAPAEAVYVTVERGQAFLLSGEGINRGTEPMEVYVLTIAPDAEAATPGA